MGSETHLLTVEDLESLPDDTNRYELIQGELFVSCAPHLPHQMVVQNLQIALHNYGEETGSGIVVPVPGIIFSKYDAVIPDVVFVTNDRWKQIVKNDRFEGPPNLVIEVLSPGKENRDRDLLVKRKLYAMYGVDEYWVADIENRSVTIFRLRDTSLEQVDVLTHADIITSPFLPDLKISVERVFKTYKVENKR